MNITYQEAIAYSHNYATAKPDIGATEREHILGLCQVLEDVGKERDRFSRLFANACESLGAVQEALGNEDAPETTGLEPHFVRKLKDERDALTAHVERLTSALVNIDADLEGRNFLEDSSLRDTCREATADAPTTSLARLKAQWQVEVLQHMLGRVRRNGDQAVVDAVEESIAIELRRQAGIGEGAP